MEWRLVLVTDVLLIEKKNRFINYDYFIVYVTNIPSM